VGYSRGSGSLWRTHGIWIAKMKKKSRKGKGKRKEKWVIGLEAVIIIVSSIITSIENQSKQHNVLV